jgi:myo-inositol 2-dehydrogenase / D-chiro-inositol 1-dehydrogenase
VTQLAFAGSGRITIVHALAARALRLPVTHVASRDPGRARVRADEIGAAACSYDALPAGADTVIVATPPSCHAADAARALAAGAAVIVEKPLCTTLVDADDLVDAARASGHRLGYAENLAFAPIFERTLAIRRGIGPLDHLEVRALSERPDRGDFLTIGWGGGALFDLGVHPLALAVLVASPARVESVSCRLEGAADIPVDEHAWVELRFDDGLVAGVEASWRHPTRVWDVQAASATGVVRAEFLPTHGLEHNGEPVALPEPRTPDEPRIDQFGYLGQLETFVADFAAGRRPALDAVFGREMLEIVCAAYLSAGRGGEPQPVPYTGPRDRTPVELWRG